MRHVLTFLTFLSVAAIALPASAQFLAYDERPEYIISTTTTTSAVAVGVIMLTVVNVRKEPSALRQYLDHNEPAIRAAMAVGAGEVVDDLGLWFGVPERDLHRFGRLLRRHRANLQRIAYDERDADRFIQAVEEALRTDV